MSDWPSTKANRVLAALLRIGWVIKRQSGTSHRVISRRGWTDLVFAFHDHGEIGPADACPNRQAQRAHPRGPVGSRQQHSSGESFAMAAQVLLDKWAARGCDPKVLAKVRKDVFDVETPRPWRGGCSV